MKAKNLIPKVASETFKSVIYTHPNIYGIYRNHTMIAPTLKWIIYILNILYTCHFYQWPPPPHSLPIPTQHSDLWLTSMRQSYSHSEPLYFIHRRLRMLLHTSAGTRFNFFTVKKKINDCGTKNGSHTLQVINITSLFIERGLIPS